MARAIRASTKNLPGPSGLSIHRARISMPGVERRGRPRVVDIKKGRVRLPRPSLFQQKRMQQQKMTFAAQVQRLSRQKDIERLRALAKKRAKLGI